MSNPNQQPLFDTSLYVRALYDKLTQQFKIRSVVVGDTRGAARKKEEAV